MRRMIAKYATVHARMPRAGRHIMRVMAIALLALTLSYACSDSPEHSVRTIGVSQSSLDDAWRKAMVRDMQIELSNYDDIHLVVRDAGNSSELQARQIRELAAEGVDIMVISPVESAPLTGVAQEVFRSGIPTIITDRKVDTDEYTVFIGADNYAIGYDAGRYAAVRLAGRRSPVIAEIWGLRSSSPAQERHAGFVDALADDGIAPQIVAVDGEWSQYIAADRMDILGDPSRYDLVYSHNDVMAISAREYFDRQSPARGQKICIIGVDAVASAGLDAVADGRIDISFLYPTAGAEIVRIADSLLHGRAVEKNIFLESASVDGDAAMSLLIFNRKLTEYQQSIEQSKRRLDSMVSRFGSLKQSLSIIAMLCVALGVLLFLILRANSKIRLRNALLDEKRRREEEQNRRLTALNREIEEATAQKLQFFTNVSHEIRTPLTLILGPLEKIMNTLRGTHFEADLSIMHRNGQRLLHEINRMLDFRRLENGGQEIHCEPTSAVEFVEEIKCYFDAVAHQRHIDYRLMVGRSSDAPERALLDRNMIEKVLVNLLSNAFKFTPDGGSISIRVDDDARRLAIEVEDSGCGIAPENLPHIFERFFTGKSGGSSGGSGIGLNMAREYSAMHGGTLSVESEQGRFTRFTLVLPHLAPQDASSGGNSAAGGYDMPAERAGSVREALGRSYDYDVLVVDDDDDMREYIAGELGVNFRVHVVSNGAEAMEFIGSNDVSVVVSDVMMPVMNGFQLCDAIKSDMRFNHIPVVLLTALNSERHNLYGTVSGADDYIPKPFDSEYLRIKIIKLVDDRIRMRRRLLERIESERGRTQTPIESADDLFLRRFVARIAEVYADGGYNVERLSEDMAMSRGHLYRKVRELTGLSPVNYLQTFRLRRAREILSQSDISVSEAAYATGFSSPAYFTKSFREQFGMTPTEFKKNLPDS